MPLTFINLCVWREIRQGKERGKGERSGFRSEGAVGEKESPLTFINLCVWREIRQGKERGKGERSGFRSEGAVGEKESPREREIFSFYMPMAMVIHVTLWMDNDRMVNKHRQVDIFSLRHKLTSCFK